MDLFEECRAKVLPFAKEHAKTYGCTPSCDAMTEHYWTANPESVYGKDGIAYQCSKIIEYMNRPINLERYKIVKPITGHSPVLAGPPEMDRPPQVPSLVQPVVRPARDSSNDVYLFYDTETTGLINVSYDSWKTRPDGFPRIVELAWILTDAAGQVLNEHVSIFKPDGYEIPVGASNVHGITTEKAHELGVPEGPVIAQFAQDASKATHLVAHNIQYDYPIVGAALVRHGIPGDYERKLQICTMNSSTSYCRIPGRYGSPKKPKLIELHHKLFNEGFEGAHSALDDIRATSRCFFELKKLKVIQ